MTGKKKLKISWMDCKDKSSAKLSKGEYITIFYPFGTISTYTCIIWTKEKKQVLDDDELDVIKFKTEMYLNLEIE